MNSLLKFASSYLDDDIAAYTNPSAQAYRDTLALVYKPDSLSLGTKVFGVGAGVAGAVLGAKALDKNMGKLKGLNPLVLAAGAYGAYKGGKKLYNNIESTLNNSMDFAKGIGQGVDYRWKLHQVNKDIQGQRKALANRIINDPDTMHDLSVEYARHHSFTGSIGNIFHSHKSRVADILNKHNYSPDIVRNYTISGN